MSCGSDRFVTVCSRYVHCTHINIYVYNATQRDGTAVLWNVGRSECRFALNIFEMIICLLFSFFSVLVLTYWNFGFQHFVGHFGFIGIPSQRPALFVVFFHLSNWRNELRINLNHHTKMRSKKETELCRYIFYIQHSNGWRVTLL